MESELRAYRANPTDRRFSDVYRVASPWLKSSGLRILGGYRCLCTSGSIDDLIVEGALSLSRSARRFVYFCSDCGQAFVHVVDLSAHRREVHRRRGVASVSLSTFSRTSANLAMRRTARRLVRPEIPKSDIELGIDDQVETTILFEILISSLGERIWARARESLRAILEEVDWTDGDLERVRGLVVTHLGYGAV